MSEDETTHADVSPTRREVVLSNLFQTYLSYLTLVAILVLFGSVYLYSVSVFSPRLADSTEYHVQIIFTGLMVVLSIGLIIGRRAQRKIAEQPLQ